MREGLGIGIAGPLMMVIAVLGLQVCDHRDRANAAEEQVESVTQELAECREGWEVWMEHYPCPCEESE